MGVGLVGTGPGIGSVGNGNGGCSGGIGTSGGTFGGLSIVVIFLILRVHSWFGKTRPEFNKVIPISASRLSEGAKRLTPQNLAVALNLAPNDRTRSFGYPDQAHAKQTTGER
jgi:hypothetical protein